MKGGACLMTDNAASPEKSTVRVVVVTRPATIKPGWRWDSREGFERPGIRAVDTAPSKFSSPAACSSAIEMGGRAGGIGRLQQDDGLD